MTARSAARRKPATSRKPNGSLAGAMQAYSAATTRDAKPAKSMPSTRKDKKGLVLYVDPSISVALRRLALDTGQSVQQLGLAALTLLFDQHGVSLPALSREEAP